MRSAGNPTVHVASAEGNRRRPLRPLRTQKEEPSSCLRKKWARAVKSSPNDTIVRSALHNGPTYVSRPIYHKAGTPPFVRWCSCKNTSSLTSSQMQRSKAHSKETDALESSLGSTLRKAKELSKMGHSTVPSTEDISLPSGAYQKFFDSQYM